MDFLNSLNFSVKNLGSSKYHRSTVKTNFSVHENMRGRHTFRVRDILINGIRQNYYSKVVNMCDPVGMLNKLKKLKEIEHCEGNLISMAVK